MYRKLILLLVLFGLFNFILLSLLTVAVKAQIIPELQKAIDNVPFARFDYPADRDRKTPPEVASPYAFAFAYYNLPYAINLDMVKDDATQGYVGIVILNFNSVKLKRTEEKEILQKSLQQLQGLIDKQYTSAAIYGYNAHFHYRGSLLNYFAREGDAIIAIRETMSTRVLINTLGMRLTYLQNNN